MSYTYVSPVWARNYSAADIVKQGLCMHHAVALSVAAVGAIFQGATAGSTQWSLDNHNVGQHVPENAIAYAAGDAWANAYLEHVEVCNDSVVAPYPIGEDTIDNLVEFMAERSIKRGWGNYIFGINLSLGYHQLYSATACPGALIPRAQEIANRANDIINNSFRNGDFEMAECIYQPDGKQYLVWFDGTHEHDLQNPDELTAIAMVYKASTGKEIPIFALGQPGAPWSWRFQSALLRGASKR